MALLYGALGVSAVVLLLLFLRPAEPLKAVPSQPAPVEGDVLVGTLRTAEQLDICLQCGFYHVPCQQFPDGDLPVRYVAIYQSVNLFGGGAGVSYYGRVTERLVRPRSQITQIPSDNEELYFVFRVAQWQQLPRKIEPKETAYVCHRTNLFLLTHSAEVPQLWCHDRAEFEAYEMLRKAAAGEPNPGVYTWRGCTLLVRKKRILLLRGKKQLASCRLAEFAKTPAAVLRTLRQKLR